MIDIFVISLFSSVILFTFGSIFQKFAFNQDINTNKNFSECSIYGIIFLSFLALIINFILPINKLLGDIVCILSASFFLLFFFNSNYKKKLFIFLIFTSIITFFLLVLSTVNRPDAGLYHLPYVRLINDYKIILGASNIHFRFGHISIVQYLSAIYNSNFFATSSITVPLASTTAIFITYLINKFYNLFEKKNNLSFVIFLILIFSLYSFNRYSSYGNDAPSHIYFFILAVIFLDLKNLKKCDVVSFYKICFISIFLLTLKMFMIVILAVPFLMFLISDYKKEIIFNKNFIICIIFVASWILKNTLISGCLVYPIQKTCFKNLNYYDDKRTEETIFVSEAWAKGWSDQNKEEIILKYNEYNKNFNWVKTWKKKHLKKIYEKILPFTVFLAVILIYMILNKLLSIKKISKYQNIKNSRIYILLSLSILLILLWFLKFPIYRYGSSFIALSIILITTLLFKEYINLMNKKFYTTIIIIGLLGFLFKNSMRITDQFNNNYNQYPWPAIYSLNIKDNNVEKKFKAIDYKDEFVYYYNNGELCMYTKSPCSNYKISNLRNLKINSYLLYYLDK
jgi:hypothetical protein